MSLGMTTKDWRLSPLAEDDLEAIWLYTLRHWSVAQANSYYRQLIAEIGALAAGRTRGRNCTVRAGYLKRSCGSHVIFFRDLGDALEIIRILHGAQDVERHL